ncbi:dipeptidase [Thermodesulforhabdus norvegica]|uniref:Acetylornithine deacetylase/Succinyl-diaminopimelate desuccinylase n=1 Tax=Thermodesulforhabdus norvegica TaxID=39841 RepID=A0A1I4R0M2_9BACT|nr:dipeptidase [Thermodesulforhabdus norvegica]SFM45645.1 Acetylornithine deacetylase/Succinyl-diaminopimelate desuccinylase [Thermodesulforhabdus norvegica]
MAEKIDEVFKVIDEQRDGYLHELLELLRLPSVSANPTCRKYIENAAERLCKALKARGAGCEVLETEGHPVVCGSFQAKDKGPTLLIYGHYDVQPPDPLEEWQSDPFDPVIKDGYVYARGASDDKGQLFCYVAALDAINRAGLQVPVNLRFLFEGEEEIGSPNLRKFLLHRHELLESDAVVISDGSQAAPGVPAITYGLRGLAYLQIDVEGPKRDLHSGVYGGIVVNPLQALVDILSHLKDENDRVMIEGFYDDVLVPDETERAMIRSLPFDEEQLKEYLGISVFGGEKEFHPLERRLLRPTLDVNGIWGGYSGPGAKTVIPSRAGAKISMRLVPNQRYKKITDLTGQYIRKVTPPGVRVKVTPMEGTDPVLVNTKSREVQIAARALEIAFGRPPVFMREGGSIPVVSLFSELMGSKPILLLGFGRPDDGIHGPNERFNLDDFFKGIKTAVALFFLMAER